jgi:hypothetical protein
VAQALRALDRMTPNAATTKAQLAGTTPTDRSTAGNGLPASWAALDAYRAAVSCEKRLSWPEATRAGVETGVEGTVGLLGTRERSNIIRRRWWARGQTCPCSALAGKGGGDEGGGARDVWLAGDGNKESSARNGMRQRRQRALGG